jgi:hypothetical protein
MTTDNTTPQLASLGSGLSLPHNTTGAILLALLALVLALLFKYRRSPAIIPVLALAVPVAVLSGFMLANAPGIPANFTYLVAMVLTMAIPLAILGGVIFWDLRGRQSAPSNNAE